MSETTPFPTQCGYVAIAGRPNVGKSTLLNRLIGQKISITSAKPQTTRHRLLGIKTLEHTQIVYVDTPGLQAEPQRAMNRYMNRTAFSSLEGVDVLLCVIEAGNPRDRDEMVFAVLEKNHAPVILAINKIDRLKERGQLLPAIQELRERFAFAAIVPISAKQGDNVQALETEILRHLPQAPFVFPEDYITDRSQRFLAAELIREKLMRLLGAEVPYQLTVEIEHFGFMRPPQEDNTPKANSARPPLLHIAAVIWVERPGQKRIVIGNQGQVLKQVGTQAREDMEKLFDSKIFLQLWVKVRAGWPDDERMLTQLGYVE